VDIHWQNTVEVDRPIEQVYTYLADFSRHREWAQTLDRLEQVNTGDSTGVGARYLTFERQAMQSERKPHQALTKGLPARTLCEVRELVPNRRIAWHAHAVPKVGLRSHLAFEFASTPGGGTALTQPIDFHQPPPLAFVFRLIFGRELVSKAHAQWQAGLRNIKTVLEQTGERPINN